MAKPALSHTMPGRDLVLSNHLIIFVFVPVRKAEISYENLTII